MIIGKSDLDKVREEMDSYVGNKVRIKANKGRKRIDIKEGYIENTYPSIFVVKVQNESNQAFRHVSYSYTDVLTKNVEISTCE